MSVCPVCNREMIGVDPAVIVAHLNFGYRQREIIEALLPTFGEFVPTGKIVADVYGDEASTSDARASIKVLVSFARRKLHPKGLTIEGRKIGGYRLTTWAA